RDAIVRVHLLARLPALDQIPSPADGVDAGRSSAQPPPRPRASDEAPGTLGHQGGGKDRTRVSGAVRLQKLEHAQQLRIDLLQRQRGVGLLDSVQLFRRETRGEMLPRGLAKLGPARRRERGANRLMVPPEILKEFAQVLQGVMKRDPRKPADGSSRLVL